MPEMQLGEEIKEPVKHEEDENKVYNDTEVIPKKAAAVEVYKRTKLRFWTALLAIVGFIAVFITAYIGGYTAAAIAIYKSAGASEKFIKYAGAVLTVLISLPYGYIIYSDREYLKYLRKEYGL